MKRVLCLLLCSLAWCSVARADYPPVREVSLPNGLMVLIAPDSLAPAVDVAVWVRAGVRYESPGRSGATHLAERLMFRGTARTPSGEHQRRIRAEGGTASSFTTADYSCLFETLPPEDLGLALRLEADRFSGLAWSAAKLDAEKRGANDDDRRRTDGLMPSAARLLDASVYAGHPYALPVSGLARERNALTLANLQSYVGARYVPSNMLLTIVGRVHPDTALALARRTLGALPARARPSDRAVSLPDQEDERHATTRGEFPVPVLLAGWRAPGGADTSRVAFLVLARLLGNGPASRLSRKLVLVDQPLCLAVEGAYSARRESALLYAVAVVPPSADTIAIEAAVQLEANRLRIEGPEREELERVKLEVERDLLLDRQSARGRAQAVGTAQMVSGDWRDADRDLERLRSLTPGQVKSAAAQVFLPSQFTAVWVWPSNPITAGAQGAR